MEKELLRRYMPFDDSEQRNLDQFKASGIYPEDRSVYSAKFFLLAPGKQIEHRKHRRFERCPEHTHDYVEMVYMLSGQTTHLVNGKQIILCTGDLLLLNLYARHENPLPAEEGDIALNFIILPPFFETTLAMMGSAESALRKFLLDCLHNKDRADGYLLFKVTDVQQVQHLVQSLIWTFINREPNQRSTNQFAMGILFLHLLNCTDKVESNSKKETQALKILRYVEEHYQDGTLDGLAKLLGYDMKWLSKEITRVIGSSYKELQQNKRISQAKFLLSMTGLTVAEIANQVGYNNIGYFHQLFQARAGCSPREFSGKNKTN